MVYGGGGGGVGRKKICSRQAGRGKYLSYAGKIAGMLWWRARDMGKINIWAMIIHVCPGLLLLVHGWMALDASLLPDSACRLGGGPRIYPNPETRPTPQPLLNTMTGCCSPHPGTHLELDPRHGSHIQPITAPACSRFLGSFRRRSLAWGSLRLVPPGLR